MPNLPDGIEVDVTLRELRLTPEDKKRRLELLFGGCQEDLRVWTISDVIDLTDAVEIDPMLVTDKHRGFTGDP